MQKKLPYIILIILCLLPFLVTWLALPYFPQTIPTHYDLSGNPDDFSSKSTEYILAVVFSISGFVMLLIAALVNKYHSDEEEDTVKAENNARLVVKMGIGMMLLFIVMEISELMNVYYYVTNKGDFPELKITNIVMMLLLIYIGNLITKSKRNATVGIRTSWSTADDESWAISQRAGGIALIASSVVIILVAVLLPNRYQVIVLLVGILFVAACTLIVSHKAVVKHKASRNL